MSISFELNEQLVVKWAKDRNLIDGSTSLRQWDKLLEEMQELGESLVAETSPIDDIGDCLVVLAIIARQQGLDLNQCFAHAYNDIKDRKGKIVDGIFVKEV